MSKNNSTILYAGIDVANATLQLSLAGTSHPIDNDARGHARILKLLRAAEKAQPGRKVHVILEATGGYEAALCGALHAAERTLSVIQPSRRSGAGIPAWSAAGDSPGQMPGTALRGRRGFSRLCGACGWSCVRARGGHAALCPTLPVDVLSPAHDDGERRPHAQPERGDAVLV
jgi:hypothetical protein